MATKTLQRIDLTSKPEQPAPTTSPIAAVIVAALKEPEVIAALRAAIGSDERAAEEWLGRDAAEKESGLKMETIVAAARKGELEIGYAGRSPRVRRGELARWIATKRHPLAKAPTEKGADAADVYDLAVRRARGGR